MPAYTDRAPMSARRFSGICTSANQVVALEEGRDAEEEQPALVGGEGLGTLQRRSASPRADETTAGST